MFFVEPTQYGWSVRVGNEQVGLFLTQRQALQDVKKRRADLEQQGQHSTLVVTGMDPGPAPRAVSSRPWPNRKA
jgi:hypothetical protein